MKHSPGYQEQTISQPSLVKQNWLYPKLLSPLGACSITAVNPLSLFPDGIPGYVASDNPYENSPFFAENRAIEPENFVSHSANANLRSDRTTVNGYIDSIYPIPNSSPQSISASTNHTVNQQAIAPKLEERLDLPQKTTKEELTIIPPAQEGDRLAPKKVASPIAPQAEPMTSSPVHDLSQTNDAQKIESVRQPTRVSSDLLHKTTKEELTIIPPAQEGDRLAPKEVASPIAPQAEPMTLSILDSNTDAAEEFKSSTEATQVQLDLSPSTITENREIVSPTIEDDGISPNDMTSTIAAKPEPIKPTPLNDALDTHESSNATISVAQSDALQSSANIQSDIDSVPSAIANTSSAKEIHKQDISTFSDTSGQLLPQSKDTTANTLINKPTIQPKIDNSQLICHQTSEASLPALQIKTTNQFKRSDSPPEIEAIANIQPLLQSQISSELETKDTEKDTTDVKQSEIEQPLPTVARSSSPKILSLRQNRTTSLPETTEARSPIPQADRVNSISSKSKQSNPIIQAKLDRQSESLDSNLSSEIPNSWSSIAELISSSKPIFTNTQSQPMVAPEPITVQPLSNTTSGYKPVAMTFPGSNTVSPNQELSAHSSKNVIQSQSLSTSNTADLVETEIKEAENNQNQDEQDETDLMEILAREIYHLLRQRLEVERERQGGYYSNRLL